MRVPNKFAIKERTFTTAMIVLATIVVIVLGALQYRWSNQVSEATSIRLADSLQMSMINWHLDFFRDFSEVCVAMQVGPTGLPESDWNQYALRFAEWQNVTAHPGLVSRVYILKSNDTPNPETFRIDSSKRRLQPATWPLDWDRFREELKHASAHLAFSNAGPNGITEPRYFPDQPSDREFAERLFAGGASAGWRFDPDIPALVHALPPTPGRQSNEGAANWIIVALDNQFILDHILPDLAQRYFRGTQGLDYQIAVTAGNAPGHVMYSSDPDFGDRAVADADGTMDIFGRVQNKALGSPVNIFHAPSENKGPATSVGISWFPLLHEIDENQDWRLIVRHRRGGALGAFVQDSRRRDLAISFGVLFLLVVSIAILIITSTRAQRLAMLQMDFVTAVSHELRTPLTVISSAAENIAHGVVEGRQQLEQYGSVIGIQARKLFEMVEQILLFAAIREGHERYSLRPLEVTEILDLALSNTGGLIETADFRLEQNVEPHLPQILGDLSALSQCVQNLITNALKYGSEQRWIGIQARLAEHGMGGKEIQISVSDRGIGIDHDDLMHIFEPFYRSPSVTAAQIHGTGLGLPLAKSIAEAMKGHVTVKSKPGQGSTFTLHLPCLEQPTRQADTKVTAAVSS